MKSSRGAVAQAVESGFPQRYEVGSNPGAAAPVVGSTTMLEYSHTIDLKCFLNTFFVEPYLIKNHV